MKTDWKFWRFGGAVAILILSGCLPLFAQQCSPLGTTGQCGLPDPGPFPVGDRRYNRIDTHDEARAIVLDGAGNVYVTGFSDTDPDPNKTNFDYVTIKYDRDGCFSPT